MDYWAGVLTPAPMFNGYGCGREEFQEARETGLVSATRPARGRCCRRILQDPESAIERYGPECRQGTCWCRARRPAKGFRQLAFLR